MSLKFTPPKEQSFKYGVWVEGRGFAVKSNLGNAKLSAYAKTGVRSYSESQLSTRRIIITEQIHGDWFVLFDVPAGTAYKDLPWIKMKRKLYWNSHGEQPVAVSMTREEYAEWRVAVELERRGIEV